MNTSDSRKNKWIAGGAILVMLLAGGSILRIRSLQGQASPSDAVAQAAAMNASLELSPEQQKRRLELVTHLRDTWKPWAKEHQSELRRMLSAAASDIKALDAVCDAIPTSPIRDKELTKALNANGDGSTGETFTWNMYERGFTTSQIIAMPVDEKKDLAHSTAQVNWNLQDDFASLRDIVLSQSTQTGTISVSLWASGRVTEDTFDDRQMRSPQGFALITYKRKEILPPYDFLTSKD